VQRVDPSESLEFYREFFRTKLGYIREQRTNFIRPGVAQGDIVGTFTAVRRESDLHRNAIKNIVRVMVFSATGCRYLFNCTLYLQSPIRIQRNPGSNEILASLYLVSVDDNKSCANSPSAASRRESVLHSIGQASAKYSTG
jgi:hypothetical protein